MKFNKGLVALAIAGACAGSANAAVKMITYDGPLNGVTDYVNGVAATPSDSTPQGLADVALVNDQVRVDKVYVADNGDNIVNTLNINLDDTQNAAGINFTRQDVSIGYAGDVTIPNEATFEFEVSGAAGGFAASDITNVVLIAYDTSSNNSGGNAGQFVEVGSVIDFDTNANGVVTAFKVQVDTSSPGLNGLTFMDRNGDPTAAFNSATALPAGTQLWLASSLDGAGDEYNPVTITVVEGAPVGSTITLNLARVTNTAGVPINALSGASSVVAEIVDGLSLEIIAQATSVIDVETERLQFVDEAGVSNTVTGHDETNVDLSSALMQLVNDADVAVDLLGGSTATMTFGRLDEESTSGIDSVSITNLGAGGGTTVLTAATTAGVTTWSHTGTLDTMNLSSNAGAGNPAELDQFTLDIDVGALNDEPLFQNAANPIDFHVTGLTVSAGALSFSVPLVYAEAAGDRDAETVQEATTHVWGINGAQFKTPYIYSIATAAGHSSIVKIVNEFDQDAGVSMEVVAAPAGLGGQTEAGNIHNLVWAEKVPAEGHLTLTGTQIAAALGLDATQNWHLEVTYLVNAPQNSVHAAAQNASPTGRADSPVLYRTNNGNDGRQWQ